MGVFAGGYLPVSDTARRQKFSVAKKKLRTAQSERGAMRRRRQEGVAK